MLLQISTWNKIRQQFAEDEKDLLNRVIIGETICPPAYTIQVEALSVELGNKLRNAVKKAEASHV